MSENAITGSETPKQQSKKKSKKQKAEIAGISPETVPVSDYRLFPLSDTNRFRLVCSSCYLETDTSFHVIVTSVEHQCKKDTLIVQSISEHSIENAASWLLIRRAPNVKYLPFKKFRLCHRAHRSDVKCTFAHNDVEKTLWDMSKAGTFDIDAFILDHQSENKHVVRDLISKYGGELRELCQSCYNYRPRVLCVRKDGTCTCSGPDNHIWSTNAMLCHMSYTFDGQLKVVEIGQRHFKHRDAFFKLCKFHKFCHRRLNGEGCVHAHSSLERDVWEIENNGWSRERILSEAKRAVEEQTKQKQQTGILFRCPYSLIDVCSHCLQTGVISRKHQTLPRCSQAPGQHGDYDTNKTVLVLPSKNEVRPLPDVLPAYGFSLCKQVQNKGSCNYRSWSNRHCQFYHSEAEREVWTWQCNHNVFTRDELFGLCAPKGTTQDTQKSVPGQPEIALCDRINHTQRTPASWQIQPAFLPSTRLLQVTDDESPYYCEVCNKTCSGTRQWEQHCASRGHVTILATDQEQHWKYRAPPWGGQYELCQRHFKMSCPYSELEEQFNACMYAHSEQELDEWKERQSYRRMKREFAREGNLYCYIDKLLDKLNLVPESTLFKDEMENVDIICNRQFQVSLLQENETFEWILAVVTSVTPLQHVLLLRKQDRLSFSLKDGDEEQQQMIIVDPPQNVPKDTRYRVYAVHVEFSGGFFGSFSQTLVLDFGNDNLISRKFQVDVGDQQIEEPVCEVRDSLQTERWTKKSKEVVSFKEQPVTDSFQDQLGSKYEDKLNFEPSAIINMSQMTLNPSNYAAKMHGLLNLEEMERSNLVGRFNMVVEGQMMNVIVEDTGLVNAPEGHLFVRLPLPSNLSEDTSQGQLLLSSCTTVWLALHPANDRKVYEAPLVLRNNFGFEGRCLDHIFVCLYPDAVHSLKVKDKDTMTLEVQFQVDNQPFWEMHFAVDLIRRTNNWATLFPNLGEFTSYKAGQRLLELKPLNEKQMEVVKHSCQSHQDFVPPLLLYGPFGTGKTLTLARIAILLATEFQAKRTLISTQSNSAADLYIQLHFGRANRRLEKKGKPAIRILRIYYSGRRMNTVPADVRSYCTVSKDGNQIVPPTVDDVLNAQIVIVTLHSAVYLTPIPEIKGLFSHILIDEAAQALEAEALIPITLADKKTCVVLAGDHKQISPKVYSQAAREQNLHCSLLERMFLHYRADSAVLNGKQASQLQIMLSQNYRSHPDIIRFLSSTFYGGEIKACTQQIGCPSRPALQFYLAQGQCQQDTDNPSFYNVAEIQEVAARVSEILDNWPVEWGERRQENIAVLSPYDAQVKKTRFFLRKRHLKGVTVDRVRNVQGKEFEVVVLTTVRTFSLDQRNQSGGLFGFLSDEKLLNTAITRARSCVLVVGDPIALCGVGECRNHWQQYIRFCQHLGSFHPADMSLETIQRQVEYLGDTDVLADVTSTKTHSESESVDTQDGHSKEQIQEIPEASLELEIAGEHKHECMVGVKVQTDGNLLTHCENHDSETKPKSLECEVKQDLLGQTCPETFVDQTAMRFTVSPTVTKGNILEVCSAQGYEDCTHILDDAERIPTRKYELDAERIMKSNGEMGAIGIKTNPIFHVEKSIKVTNGTHENKEKADKAVTDCLTGYLSDRGNTKGEIREMCTTNANIAADKQETDLASVASFAASMSNCESKFVYEPCEGTVSSCQNDTVAKLCEESPTDQEDQNIMRLRSAFRVDDSNATLAENSDPNRANRKERNDNNEPQRLQTNKARRPNAEAISDEYTSEVRTAKMCQTMGEPTFKNETAQNDVHLGESELLKPDEGSWTLVIGLMCIALLTPTHFLIHWLLMMIVACLLFLCC